MSLQEAQPADLGYFMETVFAERGCRRVPPIGGEWQAMQCGMPDVAFRIHGQDVFFPTDGHWRSLVANLALGCVLRQQPDIIYLHASGVGLDGGRTGILFTGPKAAGKTTTAIGLASRGHRFLGDEIVGVRASTREIVPVLRSISKREGPCAAGIDDRLAAMPTTKSRYPDGTRTLVHGSRLFTTGLAPVHARALIFLGGFADAPSLTPLTPSLETASKLTPVASTLWGQSQGGRIFALLKLMTAVPGYVLQLGPPDETARFLEDTFEV